MVSWFQTQFIESEAPRGRPGVDFQQEVGHMDWNQESHQIGDKSQGVISQQVSSGDMAAEEITGQKVLREGLRSEPREAILGLRQQQESELESKKRSESKRENVVVREAEEPSTKSFMLLNLVSEKQLPCGKLIVSLLSLLNSQGQILRRSSNLHGKRATSLTRFGTLEVHLSYELEKRTSLSCKGGRP